MDHHHPSAVVAWIDGTKAANEECEVIHDVVVRQQITRLKEVSEAVAAELFARDQRRAGGHVEAMARLQPWYGVVARRLLQSQNGTSIRITPTVISCPASPDDDVARAPLSWRRPVGLYAALGGFLAAFQHTVQRHVFQERPIDLGSGLILAVYLAIGGLGILCLLDSRDVPRPSPTGREQC